MNAPDLLIVAAQTYQRRFVPNFRKGQIQETINSITTDWISTKSFGLIIAGYFEKSFKIKREKTVSPFVSFPPIENWNFSSTKERLHIQLITHRDDSWIEYREIKRKILKQANTSN